jgi:hypothetical protein
MPSDAQQQRRLPVGERLHRQTAQKNGPGGQIRALSHRDGGLRVTHTITLYVFIGYCLLVFAGILALRVLVVVFRPAAE